MPPILLLLYALRCTSASSGAHGRIPCHHPNVRCTPVAPLAAFAAPLALPALAPAALALPALAALAALLPILAAAARQGGKVRGTCDRWLRSLAGGSSGDGGKRRRGPRWGKAPFALPRDASAASAGGSGAARRRPLGVPPRREPHLGRSCCCSSPRSSACAAGLSSGRSASLIAPKLLATRVRRLLLPG